MCGKKEYYYCVDHKALFDDAFVDLVAKRKENGEKVYARIEITTAFDEWDLEKYIERIKKLELDELVIEPSKDKNVTPYYKQLLEIQGALIEFAELIEENQKEGYQSYQFGKTYIEYRFIM